ncbi:DUF6230 family protein [Streptomyces hoynatensis]|uniref:Cholesterol esterase n=1 Tax=Streptomyces hoynatensis TaxID=1141874 RepID=A0A3A9Z0H4_9ACTN|nr:DUF6230 family protein [Streptomyces hoynatensis]RKN40877.1 cholesterol esterase [Streptomyces hoynatensis]
MESQARGGTRWRRFGLVMVPSVAATAAIGVALAQGALAASLSISGQEFKVHVDRLVGEGFAQYGTVIAPSGEGHVAAAVSAFDHADLYNLCQSVVVPVPLFGDVTLVINAGSDEENPAEADNLFIDVAQLDADATFSNVNIGVDTADVSGGAPSDWYHGAPGTFAQNADSVVLTDVEQTAWATTAGTFKLSDLSLRLYNGGHECF